MPDPEVPELQLEVEGETLRIPAELPLLPVRNTVVFPGTTLPLAVGRPRSVAAVREASEGNGFLALLTQRNPEAEVARQEDLYDVGVLTRVLHVVESGQALSVVVLGLSRFRVLQVEEEESLQRVRFEILKDRLEATPEAEAARRTVQRLAKELISLRDDLPDELNELVDRLTDPARLADLAAFGMNLSTEERVALLGQPDVLARLRVLIRHLTREIRVSQVSRDFARRAAGEIDEGRKRSLLREQLHKIHEELGESDDQLLESDDLRERVEAADLPDEVSELTLREVGRLSSLPSHSPERSVLRTYIEWILDLPWNEETKDDLDLSHGRRILDEDHFDLERVKERILEYLAVRRLVAEPKGPILCFLGPPGVGKTSLGRSIARAMGRKFVRISLGGVRDEAEIRGHRRTYVGALPGRILQGLKTAGTINPVFMLDEIDKLGMDFRGDPSSALLEVLDPEQNHTFSDHYLEIPFDLSRVLFISTANRTDTIPPPLLDRMETIELPGYTAREKVRIGEDFLLPRQLEQHGLEPGSFDVSEPVLRRIVEEYTREAGVRNLEREIAALVRKHALKIAEGSEPNALVVDDLSELLGPPRFTREGTEEINRPGIAIGLVWTPVGGDIIFVESARMKGKPNLHLTGLLGDVMRESAEAALSYVRANSEALGIDPALFEKYEIHIHVPSGGMPKDGPSAGSTILAALASLFSDRLVRDHTALTGEITLRGQVLPVGGIKEKVLAAH
ncbi:MAG: endopeptidase La, partial [Myxococcota bacterium]